MSKEWEVAIRLMPDAKENLLVKGHVGLFQRTYNDGMATISQVRRRPLSHGLLFLLSLAETITVLILWQCCGYPTLIKAKLSQPRTYLSQMLKSFPHPALLDV